VVLPSTEKNSLDLDKELEKLTSLQYHNFSDLSDRKSTVDPTMRHLIRHRLSAEKQYQGSILDLAVEDEMKLRAVFNTNSVMMGARKQWGSGVFALYSRINHSCIPNVQNSYNATIGKEVVHAIRDISKGEELLTSYVHNLRTREQRGEALKPYGFKCSCEACIGPEAEEHEARRQRLFEIDQAIATWSRGNPLLTMLSETPVPKSDAQALAFAEELVMLLKKEGLVGMDLASA